MSHIVGFFTSLPFLIGILLFILLYLLQTPILTFPIYFLMFYAGIIYGFWVGSFINLVGMFSTTTFGFYAGRMGKMDKLLEHKAMNKFRSWIDSNGFKAIIILRVAPIIPYNVTSIGSGLLKLDQRKYLTINTIAIFPFPIGWALIGDLFGTTLINQLHFTLDYKLVVPTILIIFGGILLYMYLKKRFVEHEKLTDDIVL